MAYNFIGTDAEAIVRQMTDEFERETGIRPAPASAETILLRWLAAYEVYARVLVNWAASQNVPRWAEGEYLDALAELTYAQSRPQAKPASVTVRFTISEAQAFDVVVPAGTRVTDEAKSRYWALERDLLIVQGDDHADGLCFSTEPGEGGNGYAVGQINRLVDGFPYYKSVQNITASAGGSNTYTDAEFRELMKLSMAAFSTAGATESYVYHAKAVSSAIGDVRAVRVQHIRNAEIPVYEHHAFLGGDTMLPETLTIDGGGAEDYTADYTDGLLSIALTAGGTLYDADTLSVSIDQVDGGQVHIYALMQDGSAADEETKTLILAACSARNVRPLTDFVQVADPDFVTFNLDITIYLPRESEKSLSQLTADTEAAIDDYISWQVNAMGRDINPQELIQRLKDAGIKRVEIREPMYTPLSDGIGGEVPQAARLGTKTVLSGGLEDM